MQPHALTDPGLMQLNDVQHTPAAHAHRLKAFNVPLAHIHDFPSPQLLIYPTECRAYGAPPLCVAPRARSPHYSLLPRGAWVPALSPGGEPAFHLLWPKPTRQPCVLLFPNPALPANPCAGFKVSCTWRLGAQPEWVA